MFDIVSKWQQIIEDCCVETLSVRRVRIKLGNPQDSLMKGGPLSRVKKAKFYQKTFLNTKTSVNIPAWPLMGNHPRSPMVPPWFMAPHADRSTIMAWYPWNKDDSRITFNDLGKIMFLKKSSLYIQRLQTYSRIKCSWMENFSSGFHYVLPGRKNFPFRCKMSRYLCFFETIVLNLIGVRQ